MGRVWRWLADFVRGRRRISSENTVWCIADADYAAAAKAGFDLDNEGDRAAWYGQAGPD